MDAVPAWRFEMEFPQRLAAFRKAKGLTQQGLADAIGSSVIQIHRYESGSSQPTLDVIRRLAVELGVSADELLFDHGERGPDDELRLQFEAISRFDPEESRPRCARRAHSQAPSEACLFDSRDARA